MQLEGCLYLKQVSSDTPKWLLDKSMDALLLNKDKINLYHFSKINRVIA